MSGGDELKKVNMAICDKDTVYMQKLGAYIKKQEKETFQISFFSGEDYLTEELKTRDFDILILGKEFLKTGENCGKQTMCIYLSDGNVPEEFSSCPILFKYQAADSILRGIHYYWKDYCGIEGEPESFFGKKELITVFSPLHEKNQTPLTLALAEMCSEKAKVLYINFTVCGGFRQLSGLKTGLDLGDLFYLIKEDRERFFAKIKSSIHAYGNFYVILPMGNPEILAEIGKEELRQFLRLLKEKTEYDMIFLDVGMMLPGFFELLKESSRIFIPLSGGAFSDAAMEELEELLEKKKEHLEQKTHKIFLPSEETERKESYDIEEIMMGEMGKTVRRILEDEKLFGNRDDFTGGFGAD